MACYMTASNHYLNQCWPNIIVIMCNFIANAQDMMGKVSFQITFKVFYAFIEGPRVKYILSTGFSENIHEIHGQINHMNPEFDKKWALQWRHNGRDGVSNHQHHDCLLNRLFRRRSKKTLKLCVTGLCAGNSPATGEFPAQMANNAENVSIWWRHHGLNQSKGENKIGWLTFSAV